MGGGGVRGKDTGIAQGTIVPGGHTIMMFLLFMDEYLQDGERNIGNIAGMAGNGTINDCPISNFNRFGVGRPVNNLAHNPEWQYSMADRNGHRQLGHNPMEENNER